jgi:hypothetical protein
MSSIIQTGVKVHDDNCRAALSTLQAAIVGVTSQATVNSSHITYYKACLASAVANNCGSDPFRAALRELKAGGV